MGTAPVILLCGGFTDTHHLDGKRERFTGQGMVQVKNNRIIFNTLNPGGNLSTIWICQRQDLTYLGLHPRRNIRFGKIVHAAFVTLAISFFSIASLSGS